MKTFIIAAITADGFIAKDDRHSPFGWTSKEDKVRFVKITKEAGVVIMGRSTFETMPSALRERRNIVYSRKAAPTDPKYAGAEITQESPHELIDRLSKEKNHAGDPIQSVAICGGTSIYTAFMKAHLVNKLYLTVEPILFGKGLPLFSDDMQIHLKLIGAEATTNGSLMLEYDVKYHGTAGISNA